MRAAAARPRSRGAIKKHYAVCLPSSRLASASIKGGSVLESPILYAFLFLAGYVPSVFYGRLFQSGLGEELAAYYMEFSHLAAWPTSFLNQLAASFLQVLFTLLCGFSAFGIGFFILFFAFKGAFLGFCAVTILTLGGVKALVAYWLCVCLPNVFLLLLNLWLTGYAAQLSRNLFQSVFGGGAPRGRLEACARRLLVRTLVSLPVLCLLSVLGSGASFLFVRFLV